MDKQLDLHLKKAARKARFLIEDPRFAPLARRCGVLALSFLLAAVRVLPGAAPLGVSYAASRRDTGEALFAFAGAFAGSLVFLGMGGVAYAAAAVLCCTCRMVLSGNRFPSSLAFSPLCAGIAVLFIKSALVWGQGAAPMALLAIESLLAGGFCLLLSICGQGTPQPVFAVSRSLWYGVSHVNDSSSPRPLPRPSRLGPRLMAVSRAIAGLGSAVSALSANQQDEDITRVYDAAADEVCRKCSLAPVCWSRDAVDTYDALNNTISLLQEQGSLATSDFPPHFAARCVNIERFCGAVNDQYLSLQRRRALQRRTQNSQRLMREQYDSLCGVLSGVAEAVDASPEYFPGMENRVKNIVRAYTPGAAVLVYSEQGRMHIEISVRGDAPPLPDSEAFLQSLSLALGRTFCPPENILSKNGRTLRISESERLRVSVCRAVRQKHGETVCGDSTLHFRTSDGRAVILLSDGMGTGEAAEKLSRTALSLVAQFVRSGCSVQESARAVIPVLAARFEDCGFVTLDLLEINLFSGEGKLLKYGAAPTFVIRDGAVRRFFSSAMPAGAEPALSSPPEPALLRLCEGDRIVMVSDGVCDGADTDAVAQLCREEGLDAQELAGRILQSACGAKTDDDRSVLVITLSGAE